MKLVTFEFRANLNNVKVCGGVEFFETHLIDCSGKNSALRWAKNSLYDFYFEGNRFSLINIEIN
jgi:hypothetical protein